jgi:general secretion pathway protein E
MFDEIEPIPCLSWQFLDEHALIPLRAAGGRLLVATWDRDRARTALGDLSVLLQLEAEVVDAGEAECRAAIHRHYQLGATGVDTPMDSGDDATGGVHDLLALAHEPPVIQYVNVMISEAIERRASDIHLESSPAGVEVRMRIDGALHTASPPQRPLAAAVMSRLKIMAELDIAERRKPQDGRFRLRLGSVKSDVRISVVPLLDGESIALRLLDASGGPLPLEQLGMSPDVIAGLRRHLSATQGMLLVTGPTGSGKTTTLYALLAELSTGQEKVITLEDPIEYRLPGVCQIPVNLKEGLDFPGALRSVLRQDPDVILIGEIRDSETALLAAQAALTGHFVLATLHTADARGAIVRLQDLGVPPYLISATVGGVICQRLVRRVCAACAGEGTACRSCFDTGYRGRLGIFEHFWMNEDVRQAVASGALREQLSAALAAAGLVDLLTDARRHLEAGVTSEAEVRRALAWTE